MKISRTALIALAAVAFSAVAARPASAASPWQLCLSLETPSVNATHIYLLNTVVQGNAILVAGTYGHDSINNHGPVVGTLSRTVGIPGPVVWEMGLTVTIANAGDYMGSNVEAVVFLFHSDGSIAYKRWFGGNTFTQGVAVPFTCPAS
jgi:hypothetical protein